jgi:hypothetical protein
MPLMQVVMAYVNSYSEPFTFQYDFCLCEDDSVEFNLKGMVDDTMRVYIDAFLL